MIYKLYTDGSCNQGSTKLMTSGGWSYIIVGDEDKIISEHSCKEINTTNNKCEMIAVIKGIEGFIELNHKKELNVYCDSAYVVNAFKDGWIDKWVNNGWVTSSGGDVLNKEYWLRLIELFKNNKIIFNKVKRNSNPFSKKADALARTKMKS